jgi:hypothetical protein
MRGASQHRNRERQQRLSWRWRFPLAHALPRTPKGRGCSINTRCTVPVPMPSALPIFNMPVPPLLQREWVVSDRNLPPVVGPPNSPVAHHSFSTVSTGQMSTDLRPSHLINTERENRVQSATTPRRDAYSTLPVLAVAEHSAFKERRQPNAVISSGPVVAQCPQQRACIL